MSLLALLACLLAQYAFAPGGRQWLMAFYGRLCLSTAKRLNAGDRNSGILAWVAMMAAVLVPLGLLSLALAAIHPLVLWLLEVATLYFTLRFLATAGNVAAIEAALRSGDVVAAANHLAQWQGEPVELQDAGLVSKLAAEHALREAHHGTFAPLFWFVVLPGPLGLVL